MKKALFLLAAATVLLFASCAKGPGDAALAGYEKAFESLAAALESGDQNRVKAAEAEFAQAVSAVEAVSDTLTFNQKIKLAQLTMKGAALNAAAGIKYYSESEEAQAAGEELFKTLSELGEAASAASDSQ